MSKPIPHHIFIMQKEVRRLYRFLHILACLLGFRAKPLGTYVIIKQDYLSYYLTCGVYETQDLEISKPRVNFNHRHHQPLQYLCFLTIAWGLRHLGGGIFSPRVGLTREGWAPQTLVALFLHPSKVGCHTLAPTPTHVYAPTWA
jgi:hypothetical protein